MRHDTLVKVAKVFGVSVDFLLCSTNVPYRTNFDIDELGLSAKAAEKLYTGEVDPFIVSQLIENPYFGKMVQELRAVVDGTNSAAMATYYQVMNIAGKLLNRQAKVLPHDKINAKNALEDVKAHRVPPMLPDMTMVRTSFEQLLSDIVRQARESLEMHDKLTEDIMTNMIHRLEKRHAKPDLRQYTKEDIVEAIVE